MHAYESVLFLFREKHTKLKKKKNQNLNTNSGVWGVDEFRKWLPSLMYPQGLGGRRDKGRQREGKRERRSNCSVLFDGRKMAADLAQGSPKDNKVMKSALRFTTTTP